jgi:flagellar biosynthesis protein FliQ
MNKGFFLPCGVQGAARTAPRSVFDTASVSRLRSQGGQGFRPQRQFLPRAENYLALTMAPAENAGLGDLLSGFARRGAAMNGSEVLDIGRQAIWLAIQLAAPILIVGLLVGVAVGLLQALTQIQEATLVSAPKIIAVFVALLLFLPLMGGLLSDFMHQMVARITEL